jgi:NAD(P)-dependent dehydrogenase (short-subunit alcohol dehydrogenase family)
MELSAIVTGAARGIGRDVVLRLRAAGYRVVAVDVRPSVTDLAEYGRIVPIGRMSTADEVARAIVFLAAPGSAGITGTTLSVDGGYVAR